MPLEFSSSSDEGTVDASFRRGNGRRPRRSLNQPLRRQRERYRIDSDDDDDDEIVVVQMPRGVMMRDWVPRRAGTIYHISTKAYIPIFDAQHNAHRYFGDPTRRVYQRSMVDPSEVRLRCVDDGTTPYLVTPDAWLELPVVTLGDAHVRGFYLAIGDAAEDVVSLCHDAPPIATQAAGASLRQRLLTATSLDFSRRVPSLRQCMTGATTEPGLVTPTSKEAAALVEGTSMPSHPPASPIIRIGCASSCEGHRLVVVRATHITFSDVRVASAASDGKAVVMTTEVVSEFERPCQAACIFRDTAVLAALHDKSLGIVLQTEAHGVGTRFTGARHGPPLPLPTAMALSGVRDGSDGGVPVEALILQNHSLLSMMDVRNMRGRQVSLPSERLGPASCVGQTVRGDIGTSSAVVVAGTMRGVVYAVADDPRCAPQQPMVLSYGGHREADGTQLTLHDGGVQDVFLQGRYGFLSVTRNGLGRLWDLRMCCQSPTGAGNRAAAGKPVASFQRPGGPNSTSSVTSADGGCSVAFFQQTTAVCSRFGFADLYCSRTGRRLGSVQHKELNRHSSMALMPLPISAANDHHCESPMNETLLLVWTNNDRSGLFSACVAAA